MICVVGADYCLGFPIRLLALNFIRCVFGACSGSSDVRSSITAVFESTDCLVDFLDHLSWRPVISVSAISIIFYLICDCSSSPSFIYSSSKLFTEVWFPDFVAW